MIDIIRLCIDPVLLVQVGDQLFGSAFILNFDYSNINAVCSYILCNDLRRQDRNIYGIIFLRSR